LLIVVSKLGLYMCYELFLHGRTLKVPIYCWSRTGASLKLVQRLICQIFSHLIVLMFISFNKYTHRVLITISEISMDIKSLKTIRRKIVYQITSMSRWGSSDNEYLVFFKESSHLFIKAVNEIFDNIFVYFVWSLLSLFCCRQLFVILTTIFQVF